MDPYSNYMLLLNQLGNLSSSFVDHIRSVLVALTLIVLGLIVAEVVKYIAMAVLRLFRWNQFSRWIGFTHVLQKVRVDADAVSITGEFIFWILLLSFFMKAMIVTNINTLIWIGRIYFDNAGLVLQSAGVVLVSLLVAQWIAKVVLVLLENRAATYVANVARALVFTLGLNSALQMVGFEPRLVTALMIVLFGGVMIALAWQWATMQGRNYRQVIRIEDVQEGV